MKSERKAGLLLCMTSWWWWLLWSSSGFLEPLSSFASACSAVYVGRKLRMIVEYILVGIVSLLVSIYLFAALLRPDWF